MSKMIGVILVIILLGLAGYGYSAYNKNSDPKRINQSTSQDPFARITLNNPNFSNIKTHLEKNKNYYNIIGEYRPKGQNHDFSFISIFKWALKDRPESTVPFEEIIIDGKHAKHYKDQKRIYVEVMPLVIQYTRETGQLGYLSDPEFQSLLNSIQID